MAHTLIALLAADSTDDIARSTSEIWHSAVRGLPRVGVALLVIVAAWGVGRVVRAALERLLGRRHTPSFATVMAKLSGWAITAIGVMLALAVTFPSVKPVDLLASLGFFSVAIGFAFQDILENLLAGILLLFRQPFAGGDQIRVGDEEGIVERITIRETVLTTFAGERILIPNADVYKSAVHIYTAQPLRRTNFVVGVAYETDLDYARAVAIDALATVDGILEDPPAQALLIELAPSTVNVDIRFWSVPREGDRRVVLDHAIAAVKSAFDAEHIEMPCDIVALQATTSFAAGLHGTAVTPGGSVRVDDNGARSSSDGASR